MRIFLNLILILLCFLAGFLEDIYLSLLPPKQGEPIPFTIRLRQPFSFDQEKAFGKSRATALSRYTPLYRYSPDSALEASSQLQSLLQKIAFLSRDRVAGPREFSQYLKESYGLYFPEEAVKRLFRFKDLKNLVSGVLTLENSILQGKITEEMEPLSGRSTIEVLYPQPSGIVVVPAGDVITLETARTTLQEKVEQLFWQVDKGVRDLILSVALATLKSNLIYDPVENKKRMERIMERYPSTVSRYESGKVLIPFRHKLGENDLPLVSAYTEEAGRNLLAQAPWILIAILLSAIFYSLVLETIIKDEWRKDPPYHLFLSLLIMTILLLKAFLLLTPLPISALPFAALPLILVLLQNDKISAVWTILTAAVFITLITGCALNVLLYFSFTGMAAVMVSRRIRRRIHILLACIAIGVINATVSMLFWLDWTALSQPSSLSWVSRLTQVFNPEFIQIVGWTFLGGVAAGPLAIMLLPLLETSWHTVSTFKLSRYADLQHPLLKELLAKAPATYQHSMAVAYLAQSVGEAIGANTLLLRIGAYYHDIGKLANPGLFAENQTGRNPHDDLDPHESARIIIDHVINGEKIGRASRLPEMVLDLVLQHHGTLTVEFFYSKAAKTGRPKRISKKEFQYPGPKPQTVEAAIIMVCDAVEAASRSLETPTRQTIENMVRLLMVKRIAEGQFDECHLSTGSLAQMLRTLVDSLEASFHSRVVYPWQEKQKEKVADLPKKAASI
ncbi:MAG: HDIG domain-containing protein [Desulfobacteraceae bacterium]|nr:MAG: HDIG domain-containing protein [Desulfobacteraceae bacterium]